MSGRAVARYKRPLDLADLIALAQDTPGATRFLAGGQSLLPGLLANPVPPVTLLDVCRIPELRTIDVTPPDLWLGAAITFTEILESGAATSLPVLAEALRHVGTSTIRNRATIGGSLGWTDPRGELLLALLVHDAVIHTSHRRIAPADLACGPFRSILDPGELILGVRIKADSGGGFAELLDRNSAGKAIVAVAVSAAIGHARSFAIAGVADRAIVSPPLAPAEAAAWLETMSDRLPALADPFHSIGYRRAMAATLMSRVLERLAQ